MGNENDASRSDKVAFVTVGTTCFDSLVRCVDSEQVQQALLKKGYTHLLVQMGRGSYIPTKKFQYSSGGFTLNPAYIVESDTEYLRGGLSLSQRDGEDGSLSVDYFTFSPSIADYLKSADLVISHAGSGSIFESLKLQKPLIVVVNEDLMDNHQAELAEELAERKHLFCARPQELYETISVMDPDSLVAYAPGDATPVAKFINRFLGFSDE